MVMGRKSKLSMTLHCYVQSLEKIELGKKIKLQNIKEAYWIKLATVPFGQINGRMLELKKPRIYGL